MVITLYSTCTHLDIRTILACLPQIQAAGVGTIFAHAQILLMGLFDSLVGV